MPPPAICRVEEPAGPLAGSERERGVDLQHVTDRPGGDQLEHPDGLRMEPVHVRLEQDPARGPGRLGHGHRRGVVRRQRLLAQHVLAGLQRGDGQPWVTGVHRRDIDGVDRAVGQHVGVCPGAYVRVESMLSGEPLRPGRVRAADPDE